MEFEIGEVVQISATPETLKNIGAETQLKQNQEVKILGKFPDGWFEVEGEYLSMPCAADVPGYLLKKIIN